MAGDGNYKRSDDLVTRNVGGETILVPIRSSVGDLDSVFTLTPVAAHVWSLLDGTRALDELVEAVCAEYDVEPEPARNDLVELLHTLEETFLVKRLP